MIHVSWRFALGVLDVARSIITSINHFLFKLTFLQFLEAAFGMAVEIRVVCWSFMSLVTAYGGPTHSNTMDFTCFFKSFSSLGHCTYLGVGGEIIQPGFWVALPWLLLSLRLAFLVSSGALMNVMFTSFDEFIGYKLHRMRHGKFPHPRKQAMNDSWGSYLMHLETLPSFK
ncbi:unnamed protein product [Brassica rapa]|uniref:Uncharacterized protein n=1 Tax=Brassica campestris TaxID=3711 RepID=A0A3P5YBK6_BRACM|nr:unnamed protein product [Brassica rapa]VDC61134.1 unnamed protein product [Brassica rapa]